MSFVFMGFRKISCQTVGCSSPLEYGERFVLDWELISVSAQTTIHNRWARLSNSTRRLACTCGYNAAWSSSDGVPSFLGWSMLRTPSHIHQLGLLHFSVSWVTNLLCSHGQLNHQLMTRFATAGRAPTSDCKGPSDASVSRQTAVDTDTPGFK